jgi:hypothetical protein
MVADTCCCRAGLPNDNDTIYCPWNETSCYFWFPQTLNNASATAKCAGIGGYLASWNNAAEQLLVEGYFKVGLAAACLMALMALCCGALGHISRSAPATGTALPSGAAARPYAVLPQQYPLQSFAADGL